MEHQVPLFHGLEVANSQGELGLTSRICARSVSSVRRSIKASVSGSPKRTLYSSTIGPELVSMNPVKSRPTKGNPK